MEETIEVAECNGYSRGRSLVVKREYGGSQFSLRQGLGKKIIFFFLIFPGKYSR